MKTNNGEKSNTATGKPERRYEIDWLRVLGILTILSFHCARFFNFEDWHVKNNQLSSVAEVFVDIVAMWIMPLFFVVSGIACYYALQRGSGKYVVARVKRLLIPLIFGIFVLIPPQVWIERVSHDQFTGSLIEFLPHYFDGWYGIQPEGNFAWMGLHLWYLLFLFIFSLLTLPLFLALRKVKIAGVFTKPAAIFLLALPLVIIELLVNLQPQGIGMRAFAGWSPLTYLVFLITGFLIATDAAFMEAIERHRIPALILGVILIFARFGLQGVISGTTAYWISSIFRGLRAWCVLMAILGFGRRYLNINNRFLKYTNEGVLPFYMFHQTVIVVIGFYIADWQASVVVKYPLLWITSFVVIMVLYEFIVRRINVIRFLFGLKVLQKTKEVTS